jgi:hypothetical protein
MRRVALAFTGLLVLGGLLSTPALAANQVDVVVLQQGVPVENTPIDIMSAEGAVSGYTDEIGRFGGQIEGTFFRVRVILDESGFYNSGLFQSSDSPVVIELSELAPTRGGESK